MSDDSNKKQKMMTDDNNNHYNVTVIHCWSAPRSRSTALLYSFESRGYNNCISLDEPLYRTWLIQQKEQQFDIKRPYLNEIIYGIDHPIITTTNTATADTTTNTMNNNITDLERKKWQRELFTKNERIESAAEQLYSQNIKNNNNNTTSNNNIIFCKEMAKFYTVYDYYNELTNVTIKDDDDNNIIINLIHKHILLIRDPVSVLSSWNAAGTVHGNNPTCLEIGIIPMLTIYSILQSKNNNSNNNTEPVIVIDSDELANNPSQVLIHLCHDLNIEYKESMMTWKNGPHACDGPWAKWWYHDVHQSTGWLTNDIETSSSSTTIKRYRILPPSYMNALKASYPAYDYLKRLTKSYKTQRTPIPIEQIYEDSRNEHMLVYIGTPNNDNNHNNTIVCGGGRLVPRDMAKISPFDSSVQGGDACWEGLRIYNGKILHLHQHLKRLIKSAKALGFHMNTTMHSINEIKECIFHTLAVNNIRNHAHIRLTLTRGEKCTSSMNPKFNIYGTTLIILPEYKPVVGGITTYNNETGISLISASQRRNNCQTIDSKIHHNNLINNILPKIQANLAGVADALMLDMEGFVSETNATNIFMVDDGVLLTPTGDSCLPGITRATVLELAIELKISTEVRRISLSEFHSADEVFTTGTMGELTPVTMIDGRIIGTGKRGPITKRLQDIYQTLPDRGEPWATTIPKFE